MKEFDVFYVLLIRNLNTTFQVEHTVVEYAERHKNNAALIV